MSFFVTRPETPDPWICEMSTLFSAAILRTSGEDFVRRRSSSDVTFSTSFGGGAAVLGGSGAGFGGGAAPAGTRPGEGPAATPAPSILATTELTETVCPSCTRVADSVQAPGAGL